MLKINKEFAHRRYCGVHPITKEVLRCEWKDVPYEILIEVWNGGDHNQRTFFTSDSSPDKPKTIEQPKNVNTTAPNTATTRVTTERKSAEGETKE